jgi:hypothetical protein
MEAFEFQTDIERTTLRHIIIKMPNLENKERILQASREKQQFTYKGKHIIINSQHKP